MTLFLVIVFGCYVLMVFALAFGWAKDIDNAPSSSVTILKLAVVVPFRNEARSLPLLAQDLLLVEYSSDKVEFIFIDDHSTDGSADIVRKVVAGDSRFRFLELDHSSVGKKHAIAKAINTTDAEIIITTDADCRINQDWLKVTNNKFAKAGIRMVVGPVRLDGAGFFAKLQAMEFSSLVGSAAATLSYGIATMCNGANLAFRRASFIEAGGYQGNEAISSGDDDFLMKKFAARWKNSVAFLNHPSGVVAARTSTTLGEFVNQRMRWAGKWKLRPDGGSLLAIAVLAFHVCNILLVVAWLGGAISGNALAIIAGSKLFAEMIFLFPVCRFLGIRWNWISFLLLQLFYPIYVVSIGFASQILTTRWKGREVITRAWTGIS